MDVADLKVKFSADGEERVQRALGNIDRGIDNVADKSARAGRGLGTVFQIAGGFLAANAVQGIFNYARGLVDVQTNAQAAMVSLEVVTGSAERAQAVFDDIQEFAKKTPFQFPELLDATIQMEGFGLTATDWLTTVGDTAAAMNKSVDQVVQAVLDAQTGEYERLKELGIKARVEGDKVSFSYMKNGEKITETVDRHNQEIINSTLQGIWNDKYAGAMEMQSKTFGGQMSTLKDNIALTMQNATASVFQFATRGLAFINDVFADGFVATVRDRFGSGVADFIGNIGDMGQAIIDAFGEGAPVSEIVKSLPESWQPAAETVLNIADAFGDLWSKIENRDFAGFFSQLGDELTQIAEAGLDLGKIVVDAAFELASDTVSDIWAWFKEQIGVGRVASGDGTGGPDTDRTISLGDALVSAALDVTGELQELVDDAAAWIKKQINLAADRTIQIGKITLDADIEIRDRSNNSESEGRSAVQRFIDAVQKSIPAVQLAGKLIIDGLFYGIGAAVALSAAAIAGAAAAIVYGLVEAIRNPRAVLQASNAFMEFIRDAILMLKDRIELVVRAFWGGFADTIRALGGDTLAGAIRDAIGDAINAVGDWTTMLAMQGFALIMGLKDGALFAFEGLFKPGVQSIVEFVLTTFTATIMWLLQPGIDLIAGLWSGMKGVYEGSVVPGVQGIVSFILGAFAGTWNWLWNAGYNIVDGLRAGMDAALGPLDEIVSKILDIIGKIPVGMVIRSPSRVAMGWGENIVQGLTSGIDHALPSLDRSMGDVAGALGLTGPRGVTLAARPAMASGTTIIIDNRGALIGRGAEAELERLIERTGARIIDRRVNASALAGARR